MEDPVLATLFAAEMQWEQKRRQTMINLTAYRCRGKPGSKGATWSAIRSGVPQAEDSPGRYLPEGREAVIGCADDLT